MNISILSRKSKKKKLQVEETQNSLRVNDAHISKTVDKRLSIKQVICCSLDACYVVKRDRAKAGRFTFEVSVFGNESTKNTPP